MIDLQSIKDEIAKEQGFSNWNHLSDFILKKSCINISFIDTVAKRYAEEEAIAFAEWLNKNRWHEFDLNVWHQTLEHPTSMSDKTYKKYYTKNTSELYQQFKKSLQ